MGSILNEGLRDEGSSIRDDMDYESGRPSDQTEPNGEDNNNNRSDALMIAFRIFGVLTALAALLCTAVNIISMVRSFKNGRDIFEGILRCYAVVIALLVAVAETEWEYMLKFWRMLEYWVGRGMLQIFVAVMTKALSNEHRDRAYQVILSEVASGLLLACGAVYIVAGLLCIGKFKRHRIQKAHWREKASKDLEELNKQREQLEGLLGRRG